MLWCSVWLRIYSADSSIFCIPVDWLCSYPDQNEPRGYRFLNPGCCSNILFELLDFSMISATITLYCFGMFVWKCTWFPAKPISLNSNFCTSNSLNASTHVLMCDCFLKQLYLHFVTNIIVTQLFLVSSCFLELTLLKSFIIITNPVVPVIERRCKRRCAQQKHLTQTLRNS